MRAARSTWITGFLGGCCALFMGGCVSSSSRLSADHPTERAQIARLLTDIFDAAQSKDMVRLDSYHWYGPKFTKFGSDSSGRQDAAAARKGEHDGLAAISDLSMQPRNLKIDVFGDVAIATFVLEANFRTGSGLVQKEDRATMLFVKKDGVWKITHEHFSPFKS